MSTGLASLALACQAGAAASPPPAATPVASTCQADQARLVSFVDGLPEHAVAIETRGDLPTAALDGVIGNGHTLDVKLEALLLDARPVPGSDTASRLAELSLRLGALAADSSPAHRGSPDETAGPSGTASPGDTANSTETASPGNTSSSLPLYLSLAASSDVRFLRTLLGAIPRSYDVRLVFQNAGAPGAQPSEVQQLSLEKDPLARQELTRAALVRWARCGDVLKAVDAVPATPASTRWPALREALATSLPHCACDELDVPELHALIQAERRAGAAALGAVPIDFMRDERCGASFGLSPVQRVLQDIQEFDEQSSGRYSADQISFEQVLTNEHLLVDLCQALPGETLAALRREGRTFYWKVPGAGACQAWRFEPIEPGSPMGTLRRQSEAGAPDLAVHYWQGAEEIRLFGPVPDTASRPTDERNWDCSQEFALRGSDATSIELDHGRWYFDAPACERASEEAAVFPGCVASLAQGTEPAVLDAVSEASR